MGNIASNLADSLANRKQFRHKRKTGAALTVKDLATSGQISAETVSKLSNDEKDLFYTWEGLKLFKKRDIDHIRHARLIPRNSGIVYSLLLWDQYDLAREFLDDGYAMSFQEVVAYIAYGKFIHKYYDLFTEYNLMPDHEALVIALLAQDGIKYRSWKLIEKLLESGQLWTKNIYTSFKNNLEELGINATAVGDPTDSDYYRINIQLLHQRKYNHVPYEPEPYVDHYDFYD